MYVQRYTVCYHVTANVDVNVWLGTLVIIKNVYDIKRDFLFVM